MQTRPINGFALSHVPSEPLDLALSENVGRFFCQPWRLCPTTAGKFCILVRFLWECCFVFECPITRVIYILYIYIEIIYILCIETTISVKTCRYAPKDVLRTSIGCRKMSKPGRELRFVSLPSGCCRGCLIHAEETAKPQESQGGVGELRELRKMGQKRSKLGFLGGDDPFSTWFCELLVIF